jgi:hypothetical protein
MTAEGSPNSAYASLCPDTGSFMGEVVADESAATGVDEVVDVDVDAEQAALLVSSNRCNCNKRSL